MKRTRPRLQPTRIMPKRGKKRQSSSGSAGAEVGESSLTTSDTVNENTEEDCPTTGEGDGDSSKSPPVTETSTSFGSRLKSGSRKKHPRKHSAENDSSSVSFPPAEVSSASAEAPNGRESPELGCSICLGAVEDRAFTDACYHTFCFECLVEWSRVRAVCPLCKKSFHSIIHSFRSYDDYELYQVPTSYVSNVVNISSLSNPSPLNLSRAGRFWNSTSLAMMPSHGERMMAFRRRVYSQSEEMQLRGIWSSDGVVVPPPPQLSPAVFDCYPVMLERVRPWILRDVTVIIGNGEVQTVAGIVINLLQHFSVTSEEFYERLFPFLGSHTRRFLLELDAFARSPFDMTTYDARVVYTSAADADMPVRLLSEHVVEDISSGDDSDIEIVSPAMVTYSESSRSSHSGLPANHAVPDLLRYLQAVQQNMLLSFAHRPSYNTSRIDSPIPGPSGIGQHLPVLTDESDSLGSHTTTRSIVDAEVRSNSPMVLSDADSDVMVVDIDRAVHSPINISSGEEERAVREIGEIRRAKKRRRKERARRERRHKIEVEETDGMTPNAVFSDRNDVSPICLPPAEPDHSDRTFTNPLVEQNVEEMLSIVKQPENAENPEAASVHTHKWTASRSNSADPSEHTSAGSALSSSQPRDGTGKANNPADGLYSHRKRSRSANSVGSLPSKSDGAKPLTCKKHVSGHKSSKRKARELVAGSGELVCDSAEKSFSAGQTGATAGTVDLPGAEHSSDNCQNTSDGIETSSARDSKDLSHNAQLSEEVATTDGLPVSDQTGVIDGKSVPCDACDVMIDTSTLSECLSVSAAEPHSEPTNHLSVTADESESLADATAMKSISTDLIPWHPSDVDNRLFENIWVHADRAANTDSSDDEQRAASVDPAACNLPDVNEISCDNKSYSADDRLSPVCLRNSPDLLDNASASDLFRAHEYGDSGLQVTAHSSYNCQLDVDVAGNIGKDVLDGVDNSQHMNSSAVLSAGSETVSSIAANSDCRYSGIFYNLPLSPQIVETTKDSDMFYHDCQPTGSSLTEWDQSAVCPESGALVISLETLNSVDGDDTIDVGTDSSDSEVEFLDTGSAGYQRCISISSSESDDIESLSSDSDTLVLVDVDDASNKPQKCDEDSEPSQADGENRMHLRDILPCRSPVADVDEHCGTEGADGLQDLKNADLDGLHSRDNDDNMRFDAGTEYETADELCVTGLRTNSAYDITPENVSLLTTSSVTDPDVEEEVQLVTEVESSLSTICDEHITVEK